MTDHHSEDLLLRYITGKLSGDAATRVRASLDATAKQRAAGIGLRQVMAAEILERGSPDAQISLARLLDRLDNEPLSDKLAGGVNAARSPESRIHLASTVRTGFSEPRRGMVVRQPLRRGTWPALLGFALGVALIVAGWKFGGVRVLGHIVSSKPKLTTYTTANGQRATITLPDGNTVVLNVASRLEVPTNYDAGHHTVLLPVGEALFTVSHHTGTPFTVIAGSTTARVLGTSFVIRHYLTDTTATVAVNDGKVAVGTTVVTARHLVEVGPTGVLRVRPADPSRFAFATGVFTLDSMRLARAIPELDRWYNAEIRLGDASLATQLIEGNVTAGSIADLAELLKLSLDVRVVRDGRILTLYPTSK